MKELSPYFDALLFFGSQLADGGTYTCKVSNVAGQVDRTFRLTVHGENPSALFSNTLHIYFKKDVISFFWFYFLSSTCPGRVAPGVPELHPRLPRGPAVWGLRGPYAEHHLAQGWNSYRWDGGNDGVTLWICHMLTLV